VAHPIARESLLVVDDDKIILDLLCRTFKPMYEVHSAGSGEAALEVLAEHPVDLLITDQKMPGMTGLDLIAEARKRFPELQAILLPAYTEPEDLIAAINEGRVYRYVTKPWNTADLVITVKNALEAVTLRRERDGLLGRLEQRLKAMTVLVDISASAGALQSHAQVVELTARALPQIVQFDVAATLVVPPGVNGPGPATMHLHCASPGVADEALLLAARDRALDIYNQLVGGQKHANGVDQDTLIVNISGERVRRSDRAPGEQPRSEIRSSLHLPIMAPGAQGGVLGLLYVASLSPGKFTEDDEQNLEVLATQTAELLRRLSARILDERRKMELMVASMADGLIMTDAAGEVFLINPAARKMLGTDSGTGVEEAVTAKYLKEKLGFYPFDLVRSTNGSETVREELKVNDRFLHSIVSPVNDTGGAAVGVVVVLRDITEQKALDHRKEEFVSIVSHELRTPLTSITGALDIVLKQYQAGLSEKQSRYLEMALDSAQKLNGIVDDLLDVAKVERGKLSMRMGALDLAALARDAVERFRAAGEQKNIQLGVRGPGDGEVRIVADADRLTQVINNLLSNAIKFTPEGGRIEVDIFGPQVSRSFVGLSIWNNGVSISEQDRERVFDKFEQIQSSNTRKVGGTGLGLAISRGIVEGHGGRIWVEGTRDEEGTRFVVALPNTPPEGADTAIEPHATSASARSVLVVDDDRYTTYILKGMLVAAGYKVYLAHDGDGALGLAREKKPDLVTVDLRMPGVDGLAVVEILKHDPDTRKMPIVVLSVSDDRDRAVAVGADAFLQKPVDAEPLLETIARLLAERGKSRQKILLVDDDPGIRMICRDVLEGQGYLVREAGEGEAAQKEARRFRPDLVLVDVMMPGMDGFTLAQKLRGDRETSLTPIIFLSARGQTADKVRAFKLGAEDYLVKPFDSAELVARVEKALARRDLELGASPTTRLPGSQAIEAEIDRRLASGGDFAFCYLDLDNLKAFNDYYGYAKADGVILQTGDIVREVVTRVGGPGDFIGHIAGDDFVFITTRDHADQVCMTVIETFDRLVPLYYNKIDRERGFIETNDRYGVLRRFPIMSVSIACATRSGRNIISHSDLSAASAELKQRAKAVPGSAYVRDGNVIFPRSAAHKAG
jgi:PAS domain S-box-containing protein